MTNKNILEKLLEIGYHPLSKENKILQELISNLKLDVIKESSEKKENVNIINTINQCLKYNLKTRKNFPIFSNYDIQEYKGEKYLVITNSCYLAMLKYKDIFENVQNLNPEFLATTNFPKVRTILDSTNYENYKEINLSDEREILETSMLNFKLGKKKGNTLSTKEISYKFKDIELYFNPELIKMGFKLLGDNVKLSYQDTSSVKPIRLENDNGDIFIVMPFLISE